MKHYYLIKTIDDTWRSSYKKICETLEEAEKEVPNFEDCYCEYGTCEVREVDSNFITYKVYKYVNGRQVSVKVYREED